MFTTAEAAGGLLAQIRDLLVDAFAGDFSDDDWDHTLGGWHVVAVEGGAVVSHAAVVPRVLEMAGRRLRTGYVEGVATAPARQRHGLGSLVLAEVSGVLQGGYEMGALSTGLHDFYARLGWERWRGPTFVRRGPEAVRTPEDDDGVMVLRFGPSADVDLSAPLSCESRRGDDW
ncbi:aminoglycoside N-acetyltransferase AAC(2')-Ic [soil metagenome]